LRPESASLVMRMPPMSPSASNHGRATHLIH
jgi:hypothetical protein